MTPDDVANELRAMFRDGCTVGRLVGHAVERLGERTPQPRVAMFVRETFGLHPGGWTVLSGTESFGTGRVPDSVLTWVFLPQILANRAAWDEPGDEPRWYDGLTKEKMGNHRTAAAGHHEISPEGWATLGDRDRDQVIFLESMRLSLSEDVQLLAALAERLQRRVNELEQQNHRPATVGTA